MFFRFVAALLLVFCLPAFAQDCKEYRLSNPPDAPWFSSRSAACSWVITAKSLPGAVDSAALAGGTCYILYTNPQGVKYPQLTSGFQERTGPCQDTNCSADSGKLSTLNFTVGWARSGNADARDWLGSQTYPSYSSPVCSSGCSQELTGDDSANSCYRSQVPAATGLHRISCDYQVRGTGKSCTPGPADAAHDSKTPPEPCPGFVGEVNGETKCVGTASKPIPAPSGQGVSGATGKGEQSGNPTAGKKPGSGEGSGNDGPGRTPTAGTGTASGGPAGAAGSGTKPDGTTDKPTDGKEQAACGAPGQAKCSINEAGTPDGKGSFDEAKGEMEAQGKRQLDGLDGIKRTDDKDTSWGVIPSWIAHGECSPWNLGTLPLGPGIPIEVDICRIVPYVNAVSNFLWAVFTFFATISMVFRVTTATKD